MNFRPPLFAPVWAALPRASSTASDPAASPANLSPEWQELGQAWRTEPEADLNPGWARDAHIDPGRMFMFAFASLWLCAGLLGLHSRRPRLSQD